MNTHKSLIKRIAATIEPLGPDAVDGLIEALQDIQKQPANPVQSQGELGTNPAAHLSIDAQVELFRESLQDSPEGTQAIYVVFQEPSSYLYPITRLARDKDVVEMLDILLTRAQNLAGL